jgi:hypothetical protein
MWCFHATGRIWCKVLYQHIEYVIQLSNISIKSNFKQIAWVELKLANAVIWISMEFMLLHNLPFVHCPVNYCLVVSFIILLIVLSCELLSVRVFHCTSHWIVLWTTVFSCLLLYCSLYSPSFKLRLFKLVCKDGTCIGVSLRCKTLKQIYS